MDVAKKETKVLAVDFGASSGRVMLGTFDGNKITAEEIHRFSNDPVIVNGTMYCDVLRLFGGKVYLLENPVHYRDGRTEGMVEKGFTLIPRERFYELTGNQFMEINTVFQLLALKEQRPELLDRADCLLLMPDWCNTF